MTTGRRLSSRVFGQAGQRRLTSWELGPGGDDLGTLDRETISTSASVIIGSGATPIIPHLTIVRIRGFMEFQLTAASVAISGFNYVAGIGVVTNDAFVTGGVASIPDPFVNINWPGWMWLHMGSLRTSVGALAVGDPSINPVRVEIDAKAMRKLRVNETMAMVVAVGETSTAIMQVAGLTRVLVKLP